LSIIGQSVPWFKTATRSKLELCSSETWQYQSVKQGAVQSV
jgi:hypothetical protein